MTDLEPYRTGLTGYCYRMLGASLEAEDTVQEKDHADLVARYMKAFQSYDVDTLVSLLHEDATMTMPPRPAPRHRQPGSRRATCCHRRVSAPERAAVPAVPLVGCAAVPR
jgi:hypothetical protein